MEFLVLTPEQDRLLGELIRVLPRPPEPGLSKQAILNLLVGTGTAAQVREAEWQRIYGVILLTRRRRERRQPGIPIIENTSPTYTNPRYQLIGFTGPEGQPCIFQGAIQLEHVRQRRLGDLRTRATSASEILAMKYLYEIADALDRNDRRAVRQLCRMMSQEALFILPVLSLLGQLVGAPYQQARPLSEMVAGFEQAIANNKTYQPILGKPVMHLSEGLRKHWPRIERALAEVMEQLIPATTLVHGAGNIRAALDRVAQQALANALPTEANNSDAED